MGDVERTLPAKSRTASSYGVLASQLLVAKDFHDSTDSVELYILAMPFQSTQTDGEAE